VTERDGPHHVGCAKIRRSERLMKVQRLPAGLCRTDRYAREFVMTSGRSHMSQAERPVATPGMIRGWLAGWTPRTGRLTENVNSCACNLLFWLKISCAQAEPFSSA
jgi:hypothetical protein